MLYVYITMPASKADNMIYCPKTLMTNSTCWYHSLIEHPLFWVYKLLMSKKLFNAKVLKTDLQSITVRVSNSSCYYLLVNP